jgi:hypothetical protein
MLTFRSAQYIFTQYNQSIYTLFWNENLISLDENKQSSNYCLYSVSDGKIMQHNINLSTGGLNLSNLNTDTVKSVDFYREIIHLTNDNNNDNTDIENGDSLSATNKKEFEHGITEFSVLKIDVNVESKSGYYFLIGKYDGSIELFMIDRQKVMKICTFFNHQKLITRLKFNKTIYKSDQTDLLLASGSNDTNVIIIDFQSLIQELDQKMKANESVKLFSKYKHKLVGHKDRITGLSWSINFNSNLLASCSYDSTVQV